MESNKKVTDTEFLKILQTYCGAPKDFDVMSILDVTISPIGPIPTYDKTTDRYPGYYWYNVVVNHESGRLSGTIKAVSEAAAEDVKKIQEWRSNNSYIEHGCVRDWYELDLNGQIERKHRRKGIKTIEELLNECAEYTGNKDSISFKYEPGTENHPMSKDLGEYIKKFILGKNAETVVEHKGKQWILSHEEIENPHWGNIKYIHVTPVSIIRL